MIWLALYLYFAGLIPVMMVAEVILGPLDVFAFAAIVLWPISFPCGIALGAYRAMRP